MGEKIANDDDSSDTSESSSSESESESSYSDSADDEESVVPNIHISRKPQSKKQTKQIQINSKPQSKKSSKNSLNNLNLLPDINRTKSTNSQSNSQSLRRVQTMPVFKAESGFLTKVFTKCAANSKNAYLSIASKTIFGVLASTQENVGLGSVLYNMFWSDNNNQSHSQRQKTNISNKNARFFNSGVGQETLDDFETRSRMSMNRRVQSMANFEQSGKSKKSKAKKSKSHRKQ